VGADVLPRTLACGLRPRTRESAAPQKTLEAVTCLRWKDRPRDAVASIAFRVDFLCGRVYLLRYRFSRATGAHRQFAESWQLLRNIGQKLWLSLETFNPELEFHLDNKNNL
jgi:hypothetical protein